jgi:plasmid stabilization system protein ParE
MAEVKWTFQAASDLEAVVSFIAVDSIQYAQIFAFDVLEIVERLGIFPESGRSVPETHSKEIREILFGNYRIIYRYKLDVVEILTVYHGSRILDPARFME